MAEETKSSSAPKMQRTKIQLETSYAPGALFTFEGNLVVCESLPKISYRGATLTSYSENQILNSIDERITAWYEAAMRAEQNPQPFMCVDPDLLSDDENGLKDSIRKNLFAFAEPEKMGYSPTLLTMVCNRCKRVKTFSTLNNFDKRSDELSPNMCASIENKGQCTWRQMDIVFIHPNGNYEPPVPWIYDYNATTGGITKTYEKCPRCGNSEVRIEEKSAQIGKRYYYCATPTCKMKRGKEDRWLQNDQEWLRRFGDEAHRRIADIRMKAISYRSNSVHYPVQDMIIDFGKSDQLSVLNDTSSNALIRAVAEHFQFPIIDPDTKAIKQAVIKAHGETAWNEYASLEQNIQKQKEMGVDEQIINILTEKLNSIRADWQKEKLFPSEAQTPPRLLENLMERRNRFSSRYDPFRLLIEHNTLLERIVSDQRMENGMRYYTRMDQLDEHVGPADEQERNALNQEHRRIMDRVGIETMGLVRKFETIQYSYGFTRVDSKPVTKYINEREVPVRLKLFKKTRIDDDHKHPIFVLKQNNEAIYVQLNEKTVREWLSRLDTFETLSNDSMGQQYLENMPPMDPFLETLPNPDAPMMSLALYSLLHSYAHHLMNATSEFSGLAVGSLGEYLFPADLSFIVYRKGMTMDMGNLTSMLRNNAPAFLKYLDDPHNLGCGSGSLCLSRGGACPDCLLIPEVSCLAQNQLLSRTLLIGKNHPGSCGFNKPIEGFLTVANQQCQV